MKERASKAIMIEERYYFLQLTAAQRRRAFCGKKIKRIYICGNVLLCYVCFATFHTKQIFFVKCCCIILFTTDLIITLNYNASKLCSPQLSKRSFKVGSEYPKANLGRRELYF